MIEDLDPVNVEYLVLSHILDVDQCLWMKGLKTGGLDLNISGNLGPSLTTTGLMTLISVLIIVVTTLAVTRACLVSQTQVEQAETL